MWPSAGGDTYRVRPHKRSAVPASVERSGVLVALGGRIRVRRLELGLTQEAFAERAQLHRTYVASVERGNRNIPVLTLFRIAHALEVDASVLVAGLRP